MREPLKDRIRLEHIAEAADNISRYTAGKTYEDIHKGDGSLCVLFYLCNYPGKIVHTGAACALWYLFYTIEASKLQRPVAGSQEEILQRPVGEFVKQPVSEIGHDASNESYYTHMRYNK